jgi:hypothetical protein
MSEANTEREPRRPVAATIYRLELCRNVRRGSQHVASAVHATRRNGSGENNPQEHSPILPPARSDEKRRSSILS